jgi:uncharacterized protein
MKEGVGDLVKYRFEKARNTLNDARLYFNSATLESTVNRVYYAIFYSVTALLLTRGLSSAKHSGVRSLFNKEFVKRGLVDTELGQFFSDMQDSRQEGDYKDFVQFNREEVAQWLAKAELFIVTVEEISQQNVQIK